MLTAQVRRFVESSLGAFESLHPIAAGANSRAFCIVMAHRRYFLKCYPQDGLGAYPRCEREHHFLKALWSKGVTDIPQVINADFENGCALFSWIDGDALSHSASLNDVAEACQFVDSIALAFTPEEVGRFPLASDAAFTRSDFVTLVSQRLQSLRNGSSDQRVHDFIEREISPEFDRWRSDFTEETVKGACEPVLLSPSDFGFHNAIRHGDQWVFHDFEHAGRDSAWKLLADFFCQPARPIEPSHVVVFQSSALFSFLKKDSKDFMTVFALTQLKWCLLILSVFLDDVGRRRAFALQDTDLAPLREEKLVEAVSYFRAMPQRRAAVASVLVNKQGVNA